MVLATIKMMMTIVIEKKMIDNMHITTDKKERREEPRKRVLTLHDHIGQGMNSRVPRF